MTWGVIGGLLTLLLGLGGWIIEALKNSAKKEGIREEQVRQATEAAKFDQKVNEVLAEHRDPGSADERLRRGDF